MEELGSSIGIVGSNLDSVGSINATSSNASNKALFAARGFLPLALLMVAGKGNQSHFVTCVTEIIKQKYLSN